MTTERMLANAAFGDDPGRWPLPQARTTHQLWLRAVVAGGQGRYASALADLAAVCRRHRGGSLLSLAHSTRASFLRQLGWHNRARSWDGRASALAAGDLQARADALIGLAADALGVGRFAASEAALDRAAGLVTDSGPPRLPVRLAWVSAELAMARGDGPGAVGHAQRAVDLAAECGSTRHGLKSDVVLAAAWTSAGKLESAREIADPALESAGHLGMVPLRWALACLLADIGSAAWSAAQVAAIRDDAADTVRRLGGVWSAR